MGKHMRLVLLFLLCGTAPAQVMNAVSLGIDCSGKDNSAIWQKIIDAAGEDAAFSLPTGCVDMHASTVTISSRASFKLMSYDRVQNSGGNRRPIELWSGTSGGMWEFQANQAPTIEGFLFTNTTPVAYYIQLDGVPATRISTEAMIRYNSFNNSLIDPNFTAISIVPNGNGEKNVITDNDFFCSQSRAFKGGDSGQITAGSHTVTCGLSNCSFMAGPSIGDRVRISYATGILDTRIASKTDDNHLEMADAATSTQTGARIHFRQAFGNGILIGSVNSKHNTIDRNSFTQCACGLNVRTGSFSAMHLGGSANDILACVSDISEPSELAYLEDENSLRELYVNTTDAPLTINHARNDITNAESDGFMYFERSVRVQITGSTTQGSPLVNSVLIRTPNPFTVLLLSEGNQWVMTPDHLGFNEWRGITGQSNQGALISCGDFGIIGPDGNWMKPTICGPWSD